MRPATLIRLAILGIFVIGGIGAFVFRDRLASDAGTLTVGECYDDPVGTQTINDVQHHPCNEGHTAEVVFVGRMPDGNAYPTTETVKTWIRANCVPAWNAYTGKDFDIDEILTLGYYQPTSDGWGKGDRSIICYAARVDGAAMTTTVKGAR